MRLKWGGNQSELLPILSGTVARRDDVFVGCHFFVVKPVHSGGHPFVVVGAGNLCLLGVGFCMFDHVGASRVNFGILIVTSYLGCDHPNSRLRAKYLLFMHCSPEYTQTD